ncbi:hypothetical protein B4U80_04135, partial [Leptotrombidium deliense]
RASIGLFPWSVSVQFIENGGDVFHRCGGALIGDSWIITVAHCVFKRKPKDMRAHLGNIDWANEKESFISAIEKIVVHPRFDRQNKSNDIALMKTKDIVPNYSENENINNICLPEENEEFSGKAFVTGWGRDEEDGQVSDILKALPVNLYDNSDCKSFYDE